MKKSILTLIFAFGAFNATAQDTPSNHVDMTGAILDFLSRTELCLNSCQDTESASAAIPHLLNLKQECEQLVEAQRALPEPTIQDYMAVQSQMESFNTIWNAIRGHIERLEQSRLITQEMRDILQLTPPETK